jgi:hypothetical protein
VVKNKYSSLFILAMLIFMTVFGIMPSSAYASSSVTDINGHWAQSQIEKAIAQGIVSGYPDGTFKPDQSISRAEFITMVNQAFGFKQEASTNFTDVKSTDWYAEQISRAKAAGYISGYEDGTIRPNNKISRQEVAAIMAQINKTSNPVSVDSLSKFKDASLIPTWAQEAIASVTASGIMSGYPDQTFKPQGFTTRAEAVVVINQALAVKTQPVTTLVTGITVTGAGNATTLANGSNLQMSAAVLPANATDQTVNWSVTNGTGTAGIDATSGLLTGTGVGTVTVKATAKDASGVSGTEDITITAAVSGGGGGGPSTVTTANVSSASDLTTALANSSITTITFTNTVTASPTITSPITMNFGSYTLNGNVSFNYTGAGTSVLTGDAGNRIIGTLTVNTPNASFHNGVEVSGAVNIENVEIGTWVESATGNALTITDPDGASITITGHPSSVIITAVASGSLTLTVNAGATVTNITSNAPVNIVVAAGATVSALTTNAATQVTGAGTIVTATINTNGTTITQTPNETNVASTVTIAPTVGGNTVTPGTSVAAAVNLGTAGNYVILTKAGITTDPASVITGDIGVSPIAATAITGFGLALDIPTGTFSTSSQITGKVYAADYTEPTPANLTTAISNMEAAYTDAAGRAPNYTELYAGDISGQTLTPGVYKWSTGVSINSDVTLNGGPNDVWIFQIAGKITQASNKSIILTGGAQAKNIFWQAADTVAIGTGAHFEGIILGMTNITLGTNASINGRLLAQTAVTLQANTVVEPAAPITTTATLSQATATGAFDNKDNINEMMTALWASAPGTVQGIDIKPVFSVVGGALAVNGDNVTAGLLQWIKTQWGGSSVPVAISFSSGTPAGMTADANWDNGYTVWVDLGALVTGTEPVTVSMTNGTEGSYSITTAITAPTATLSQATATGAFDNKDNINEMMTALWASAPGTVQGIDIKPVFSIAADGALAVNGDNVTAGLLQWIKTQWGGSSVPVAISFSSGTPADMTADANWDNGYTVWVDLGALVTGTKPVTVSMTNGTTVSYSIATTIADPTAGATAELAKIADVDVTTVPFGTTNDQTNVEAAMLTLANAKFDSANYTVTIASGSTYNTATNAWVGKFVVTNNSTGVNTKTDAADRNITVVIAADQLR